MKKSTHTSCKLANTTNSYISKIYLRHRYCSGGLSCAIYIIMLHRTSNTIDDLAHVHVCIAVVRSDVTEVATFNKSTVVEVPEQKSQHRPAS